MRVMNMSDRPWDCEDGKILAPGETGEAGDSARVRDALQAGHVTYRPEPAPDTEQPPTTTAPAAKKRGAR